MKTTITRAQIDALQDKILDALTAAQESGIASGRYIYGPSDDQSQSIQAATEYGQIVSQMWQEFYGLAYDVLEDQ